MANKGKTIKITTVDKEGNKHEYSAAWSAFAFGEFLTCLEGKEVDLNNIGMSGIAVFSLIAAKVATAMFVRAGASNADIEACDGDEFSEIASKVLGWYFDTMENTTKAFEGAKKK